MLVSIIRQAFLAAYFFLTLCALCYTMGRVQLLNVPWPLYTHFYAMMAPFQNYITHNVELVAEGQTHAGTWERIDMVPYFPHSRGEYAIRSRLSSFSDKKRYYRVIAKKLIVLEAERGRPYTHVRLQWHKWKKHKDGFYGNYREDLIQKTTITTVQAP